MTDPADIARAVVLALQTLDVEPKLNETSCYFIAMPTYIEGQQQLVVQVSPGIVNTDSPGKGSQEGGALERVLAIDVTVWLRLKLDRHRRSAIAMIEATNSLFVVIAKIRRLMAYTYLKGVISEPVWFLGESQTEEYDSDDGVYRRDITFGAKWGESGLNNALTYS